MPPASSLRARAAASRWAAALIVVFALAPRVAGAGGRVACVGDSITIGSLLAPGQTYPDVLGRLLGPAWMVANFGEHGRTMMKEPLEGVHDSYWIAPSFAASQAFAPDVVVIMLGTNDSKTANWREGANSFEQDYRAMIAVYAGLASRPRILLALPPPVLAPSFTISPPNLETGVLPAIARIAAGAGLGVIDVHAAFAGDPRVYFGKGDGRDIGDGVHPNPAGARLIAATVAAALLPPAAGAADAADAADAAADASVTVEADAAVAVEPDAALEPDAAPPLRHPTDATAAPPRPAGCQIGGGGDLPALLLALAALIRRRGSAGPRRNA